MDIIRIENLCHTYALGDKSVPVLHNINLRIKAGEMVAIQGSSGSGKSTLLHLLGGMLDCQEGKIIIDDINLEKLDQQQRAFFRSETISFVFQQFYLLARASVLENILLPTHYPCELKQSSPAAIEQAKDIAKQLNIAHRLTHMPNELSGGEQQRVAIARALMHRGKIILADEPTGNLDSKNTQQTLALLKALNQQGYTIILITHENDVAAIADRVIHMYDGQIVDEGKQPADKPTHTDERNIPKCTYSLKKVAQLAWRLTPHAIYNITRNKTRSLLTMLGIVIGIAAILIMVTLGQFTKSRILASYNQLGINTLLIWGWPSRQLQATDYVPVMFEGFSLENDLQPLRTIFPQIHHLSPIYNFWSQLSIHWGGRSIENSPVEIQGVNQDYLPITGKKLLLGHNFSPFQIKASSNVCIIGYQIAKRLFNYDNPIGHVLALGNNDVNFNCQVIGVLAEQHQPDGQRDPNMAIYTPYTFLTAIMPYSYQRVLFSFLISVHNNRQVQPVGKAIVRYFKEKYDRSGNFQISPNTLLLAQMNQFLNLFTLILLVIALVSLAVGGIGVANMMLSTISERLQEIGLRKALGATDMSMRILYLLEATLLCCIAGIVGLLLGFAIYETILYIAAQLIKQLTFSWIASPIAVGLSLISMLMVGIISGIVPAMRAEKLQIVDALRNE